MQSRPSFLEFLRDIPNKDAPTPFHQAALFGYADYVEKLITRKNLSIEEKTFFRDHKEKYSLDAIKRMLITPDSNNNLPLDRAAARGHFYVVKMLISLHKAEGYPDYPDTIPNKQQFSPLLSAVYWYFKVLKGLTPEEARVGKFVTGEQAPKCYKEMIDLLILSYPQHVIKNADDKGRNALYFLIQHMSECNHNIFRYNEAFDILNKLIGAGMSPDECDPAGNLRHWAKKIGLTLPPIEAYSHNHSKEINPSNSEVKTTPDESHLSMFEASEAEEAKSDLEEAPVEAVESDTNTQSSTQSRFFTPKKKEVRTIQVTPTYLNKKNISQWINDVIANQWGKPKPISQKSIESAISTLMDIVTPYQGLNMKSQQQIGETIKKHIEIVEGSSGICCFGKERQVQISKNLTNVLSSAGYKPSLLTVGF